ncbi:MAG TPA: SprT family zinc-dependent metalloprotease [Nevskiaceae bacterium]|nr:SprT family zinc-dependent metalloprotease [Nevskiaceae bacterium]
MTSQLALDLRNETPAWRLVERVSSQARSIRIEIRSGDEVLLVIPRRASRAMAHAFLRSRLAWIERKLDEHRRRETQRIAIPVPALSARQLREQARSTARALIATEAPPMGVKSNGLRIADQKTLWGSCGRNGTISLSWRLALAPPEVFRYVVIHELAHLQHRNHGPRFWALVARQMPEFEAHRRWLREHGAALHAVPTPGR